MPNDMTLDRKEMVRRAFWHTCLNCLHYDKVSGQCSRVKAVPPPEVVVFGCEYWEEELPF